MKITTKQKIINKAIALFNEKGFGSVTLFEVAGVLNMTRGNLTYHFKDKDVLLEAITDELWSKLEAGWSKARLIPSFENLHNEILFHYHIQKEYAFIFLDYHVLNHPIIKQKFHELTVQQIKEFEATIAFAISIGNMRPEPYEGMYNNLAFTTWMIYFYWLNQQLIRGDAKGGNGEDSAKKIWSMLLPHLTEKGLKAFRRYFGEGYLKELGNSFKADIGKYVEF